MGDEAPGGWELKRSHEQLRQDMRDGFSGLGARLDKLVTADAFAAEQRRVDDRLKDLGDDIVQERTARLTAQADEKKARQEGDQAQQVTLDKLTTTLRWVAAGIILPVALFLATLFMNTRGGS